MSAAYFPEGDISRHPNSAVIGWCRSRDLVNQRLTVEVLADDEPLVETLADALRRDLVIPQVSDGRHGFYIGPHSLTIPADAVFLSAREKATGRVFARIRLKASSGSQASAMRSLDRIAARTSAIRSGLRDLTLARTNERRLRAALYTVGDALASEGADPIGHARSVVAHALRDAVPPLTDRPKVAVLIWAQSFREAADALVWMTSVRNRTTAEVFVANAGGDPLVDLIASVLPGTIVLPAASFAQSVNEALRLTHATAFAALSATGEFPPVERAGEALAALARARGLLMGGGVPLVRIEPGARHVPMPFDDLESVLLFGAGRDLIAMLGGLDESCQGGPHEILRDLAIRAAVSGTIAVRARRAVFQ